MREELNGGGEGTATQSMGRKAAPTSTLPHEPARWVPGGEMLTTRYFGDDTGLLRAQHTAGENIPLALQPPRGILGCHSRPIYVSLMDFNSFHCTSWLGEHPLRSFNTKIWVAAKQLPNATAGNTPESLHPIAFNKGSRKVLHCVPLGFTNPTGLPAGKGSHNQHW